MCLYLGDIKEHLKQSQNYFGNFYYVYDVSKFSLSGDSEFVVSHSPRLFFDTNVSIRVACFIRQFFNDHFAMTHRTYNSAARFDLSTEVPLFRRFVVH